MSVNDPSGQMPVVRQDGKFEQYWLIWLLSLASTIRTQQAAIDDLTSRVEALEP